MNRMFNNTLMTAVDYGVMIGLSLIATPVLIQHLGIGGYGVFVFLSMFSFYGALSFFDFGMSGSLITYVARADADRDRGMMQKLLSLGLIYFGAIGLLLAAALLAGSKAITSQFLAGSELLDSAQVHTATMIIAANLFVQFLSLPMNAMMEGMRRYVLSKSTNTLLLIPQYVLLMLVAVTTKRIDYAFAVLLGVTIVRLLVYVLILRFKLDYFKSLRFSFDRELLRRLTGFSSILFVNRMIGLVFNQLDKILIWLYMVVSSLTIYDVVARPANLLRLVLTILNASLIPEIARLAQLGDKAGIRSLYIGLVRYAYLLLIPVVLILAFQAERLLTLWVGADLATNWRLVLILLAVYTVLPIASVASTLVVGLEKVRQTIWIGLLGMVINAGLSLALIDRFGIAGLLYATLIAQIVMVGPYVVVVGRLLDMKIADLLKPIGTILAGSIPVAGGHFVIGTAGLHSPVLSLALACGLVLLHYFVHYRWFLTDTERKTARDKLTLCTARLLPGVPAR